MLLIGERKKDGKEERDIEIDEDKEYQSADLFTELEVRRDQVSLKPIFEGKFTKKEVILVTAKVKHPATTTICRAVKKKHRNLKQTSAFKIVNAAPTCLSYITHLTH